MKRISIILLFIAFLAINSFAQKVKPGIDILQERDFDILEGKKVGLVTNPTGVNSDLVSTVDILNQASEVNLVALFGPEHGVRGNFDAGAEIETRKDPKTGIPVYSLYGSQRKPTPEMLEGLDAIVYDIQDIGTRSYTYISTMGLVMEAAAEQGKEVIILDRPNPLGGKRVEGNIAEEEFLSFVGKFPVPYIYGLTCGELAKMINNEGWLKNEVTCDLHVVKMQNWEREMTYQETGLEWVPTSPHIPHKYSPFYYAATGILGELDANAIGIGYTLPFQTLAAPWLDAEKLAKKMNNKNIPGVEFRPLHFKPYYKNKKGKGMHGVQIHITDYHKAELTKIQFYFLEVAHELNPDKDFFEMAEDRHRMFDLVSGTDKVRKQFRENFKYDSIKDIWTKDVTEFKADSKQYYLYE